MRKNVIALALSAILAISVVGCSSNNENNKKPFIIIPDAWI